MNKKLIVLLMVLALLAGVMSGCAPSTPKQENPNPSGGGEPTPEEPITLKIFAGKYTEHSDWDSMLLWQTYEEMSGIKIEWEQVDTTNLADTRNIRLASGNLPDAFYSAQIPSTDLATYGGKGTFVELGSLIEEHAPNIAALFKRMPSVKQAWTQPDGNIYSTGNVIDQDFTSLVVPLRYWVSEEWLQKTGKSMPTNTDEYYEFLKAVKEADPSIVPYTSHSFKWILRSMKGAFGLGNRGIEHEYVDYDESTKGLRFFANTDNWKEMLQYLNKLYSEQLLDEGIFTQDYTAYVAKGGEKSYASFVGIGPSVLGFTDDAGYDGTMVLAGPHGDQFTAMVQPNANGVGEFVITKNNQHPAETLKWIDYFYSKEGSLLYFMGVENKTFTYDDQGIPRYNDDILNNPNGLSLNQAVGQFTCWPGGYYPAIVYKDYFMAAEGREEVIKACDVIKNYMPEECWTSFKMTDEENTEFIALKSDIEKYVSESAAQFVAGELSFDQWDKYCAELEKMNLKRYMEIYDQAYQRYIAS